MHFSYIVYVTLSRVLNKYYTHFTNRNIKFRGIKLFFQSYTAIKWWGWELNLILRGSKVHARFIPLWIDKMPLCSLNHFLMSLLSVNKRSCRAYSLTLPGADKITNLTPSCWDQTLGFLVEKNPTARPLACEARSQICACSFDLNRDKINSGHLSLINVCWNNVLNIQGP